MKRSSVLLVLILIPALQVFGQDVVSANKKLHFNGTWIFDAKRTNLRYEHLYKGETLEISYNEPEMKVVTTKTRKDETRSADMILFTDNRGETNNPYPFGRGLEIKSNTIWDGDRLIRNYTIKIYKNGKVIGGIKIKETYTISADGNTLTVFEESHSKTTSDSQYGELKTDHKGKTKLVYTRVK